MATIAPARSRTDPPSPEQQRQRERTLLHRRLHSNSLFSKPTQNTGGHRSHRQNAKDTVASAIDLKPPISFDQLLRRDKNADGSRVAGATEQSQKDSEDGPQRSEALHERQRVVKLEDVANAKKANLKREEELRESLKDVEEIGMSRTRQLDDTYYSILEKATMLQSTVASLQQLADEVKRIQTSFETDTGELAQETTQNLDSFGNFEQQETAINGLVNQLKESRGKTNVLNHRLESARLRVEAYEKNENKRDAKRKARLRLILLAILAAAVLVVAVLVARNRRAVGHQLDAVGQQLAKVGDAVEDIALPLAAKLRPPTSEDPFLKELFDGL